MATTAASPTRDLQHRRRLSIDAEDELFKSLQGIQELNNSNNSNNSGRGSNRRSIDVTRAASPGNHSGRMSRRSIDVTRAASPGNHSGRMQRRSIPVDVTRATSPGNHSGRMNRRSVDVTRSPGSLARRQRRASLTNGRKTANNSGISPRRNTSGRRNVRSHTPPRDAFEDATSSSGSSTSNVPQPLDLNIQSYGGSLRSPVRNRRASTGTEAVPAVTKGRTARRSEQAAIPETRPGQEKGRTKQRSSSPKPTAGVPPVQRLGLRRAATTPSESSPTSPKANVYPAAHSPTRSPSRTQDWSELTMRANLIQNAKPPALDNSTTSWASFDESIDSTTMIETPTSDRTDSAKSTAKPGTSERTAQSSSSEYRLAENPDLSNLLQKLRDPAEMGKWKAQKDKMLTSKATPSLQHDKVAEKSSSRNLKHFLQRSKRGYGQQANLDGLSVVQ